MQETLPAVARPTIPRVVETLHDWARIAACEGPDFHVHIQRAGGDVAQMPWVKTPWLQITHPDDIERVLRGSHREFDKGFGWTSFRQLAGDGLISTEPARWLSHRRALQPAFMRCYHEAFADRVTQSVRDTATSWREKIGETLPVETEMSRLTLRNAGQTLFGVDWTQEVALISERLTRVLSYLNHWFVYAPHKRILGRFLPHTVHAQFRRDMAFLEKVVGDVVARRETLRAANEEPDDLLKQLFDAAQSDENRMSSRERSRFLRDNILTFIFTGHETTAICAAWMWHLLARHHEIEAQLHDELDRVLEGRAPTRSDLKNLPYLQQIVMESLRLYPPVWTFVRQTTQPETLGGYDVPTGAILNIYPYATHRHPDFWPQPERFDPTRFAPDAEARHNFAYIPFGGGPRTCIGRQTALTEAQLIVASLAQHFRLRSAPNLEIRPINAITLLPSGHLPMVLEKR